MYTDQDYVNYVKAEKVPGLPWFTDTGLPYCIKVALPNETRLKLRSILRLSGIRCNTCLWNVSSACTLRGQDGPFIFRNINPNEPFIDALRCQELMSTLWSDTKLPERFQLVLVTPELLGESEKGGFHHLTGHSTQVCEKKPKDEPFHDLTMPMLDFITKLANQPKRSEFLSRLKLVKGLLNKITYGDLYSHSVNWLINLCSKLTSLDWKIVPLVAEGILTSIKAPGENRQIVSLSMHQSTTILRWLERAADAEDLIDVIKATVDPDHYKVRKAVSPDDLNECQILAAQRDLGAFTFQIASLEVVKNLQPSRCFMQPKVDGFAQLLGMKKVYKTELEIGLTFTSLIEVMRSIENLPPGCDLQIQPCFTTQPGIILQVNDTIPSMWKLQTGLDNCALSWGFENDKDRSVQPFWHTIIGAYSIDLPDIKGLVMVSREMMDEATNVIRRRSRYTGPWGLSSQAERAHGKVFQAVCNVTTMHPATQTPLYGIGVCKGALNHFHVAKPIRWRIVQSSTKVKIWPRREDHLEVLLYSPPDEN